LLQHRATTVNHLAKHLPQLSIYPNPQPEIVLIETPHPLSQQIRVAREHTTDALSGVREQVQTVVDKWVGFERRVERESGFVVELDAIRC
jgi:MICOS complex subunit MIC26